LHLPHNLIALPLFTIAQCLANSDWYTLVSILPCYILQISSCLNCDGSGKIITEHCTRCYGSGKVKVERSIEVEIPGGIEDGSAIRITGGGSVDKQRQALGN
jgi:DnaJ-class molecular chaperone